MPQILMIFLCLSSFFPPSFVPLSAHAQTPAPETEDEYITSPHMTDEQLRPVLRMTKAGQVDQIIEPLLIRLTDGTLVRLASLDIPQGEKSEMDTAPYALDAQSFLKTYLDKQPVRLYQTKTPDNGRENRMGHQLGHLIHKSDNGWVQGALLAQGLARVLPTERNTELAAEMMALEAEARAARRGLWADPAYAVLPPDKAANGMNGWAIIEGRPVGVASVKNTIYINFGADWRSDFTIVISSALRRKLAQSGINVMDLAGKNIRIRGWVEDYNGPAIKLSAPEWLEVLTE